MRDIRTLATGIANAVSDPCHLRIIVEGIVQGVGFRPFVHRLADELRMTGTVHNFTGGVEVEIEGPEGNCRRFVRRLEAEAPPMALIERIRIQQLPPSRFADFSISTSTATDTGPVLVSPEVATCRDCLRELADPVDRRYLHPFINCTNCGPRYTIIRSMPYDRPATSMADFPMCSDCASEYGDITDRRYHAQPVACPDCGPTLWLQTADDGQCVEGTEAIVQAQRLLAEGKILALKSLGGFHLACDATNQEVVLRLRSRKLRAEKPLAVMVPDMETAEQMVLMSEAARGLLTGPQAPIVLVRKRKPELLAAAVAPDSADYGLMLPYTPIHHLLLRTGERLVQTRFTALVMTSGNLSDEPLCISNQEALERLDGIADAFLLHDRDILIGCDDSVVRDTAEGPIVLRRGRGYVPFPVRLGMSVRPVLALGGQTKNTVCLTSGTNAFVSEHLGDLEDAAALEYFKRAAEHLMELFQTRPEALACDLHPDYLSTRWGRELADRMELPLVQSQHHWAHVVSCMAEHAADGPVLGLACDGAGLGDDGTIWGCELLRCDYTGYQRLGHLRYMPMPGGDMAVSQPWRMGMAYLHAAYGEQADELIARLYSGEIAQRWPMLRQMIERDLNCPRTSSAGRLFDVVASLLGVCQEATYEGQPAMMLEGVADCSRNPDMQFDITADGLVMDPSPLIRMAVDRRLEGAGTDEIAGLFHGGFTAMLAQAAQMACEREGLDSVALSGGTFANRLLVEALAQTLRDVGLQVLLHRALPPGDGCLSLGQAVIAHHRLATVESSERKS